jgi:hypothetical protein
MNYIDMISRIVSEKEIIMKDNVFEIITDKKRYTKLRSGPEWIMQDKEIKEDVVAPKIIMEDLLTSGLSKSSGRGEEFLRDEDVKKVPAKMEEPKTIKTPEKISK